MVTALASMGIAFFLGLSSLAMVLLRVSPLSAPEYALPFLFLSIFIIIASLVALLLLSSRFFLLFFLKKDPPAQPLRAQRLLIGASLRQGIFLGLLVDMLILLWLLQLLTWWIGLLIVMVFLLIELAMKR